jgi:hypothetical protein
MPHSPKKKRSPRLDGEGLKLQKPSKSLWAKKKKGRCPPKHHSEPAYGKIHDPKKWCVKDCDEWRPARISLKRGGCGKRELTPWMVGLKDHYEAAKKDNKDYKFSKAMTDFKIEYDKEPDKTVFLHK